MSADIHLAHMLRFEISEATEERLSSLIRRHPDFAGALLESPTCLIYEVLERILLAGIRQFEHAQPSAAQHEPPPSSRHA